MNELTFSYIEGHLTDLVWCINNNYKTAAKNHEQAIKYWISNYLYRY